MCSIKEKNERRNYFSINKCIMGISGIYIHKDITKLQITFCCIYYLATCAYLFFFIREAVKIKLSTLDLAHAMLVVVSFTTSLILIKNKKVLIKIFDSFETGIFLPNFHRGGITEVTLTNNWTGYLKKFNFWCIVYTIMPAILRVIFWYSTKYTKWPFGFFWEIINYETSVVCNCILFFLHGQIFVIVHTTFITVLSHTQLHLTNLQSCIRNLIQNSILDSIQEPNLLSMDDTEHTEHAEWKYLKLRIKEVVSYHDAILDISRDINIAFRYCYLAEFVTITIILCLLIYDIITTVESSLFFIVYGMAIIIGILILCHHANQTTLKSQEIADTCYEINFNGCDIRFQKSVIMIMQRSQRPIKMIIGKFAPLSFATALSIAKITYSYVMLLQNMYEK